LRNGEFTFAQAAEVDADAISRDARRARERRSFQIGPVMDGNARVSGLLTAVVAESLRNRLSPP
jgi:hypothetical protein